MDAMVHSPTRAILYFFSSRGCYGTTTVDPGQTVQPPPGTDTFAQIQRRTGVDYVPHGRCVIGRSSPPTTVQSGTCICMAAAQHPAYRRHADNIHHASGYSSSSRLPAITPPMMESSCHVFIRIFPRPMVEETYFSLKLRMNGHRIER